MGETIIDVPKIAGMSPGQVEKILGKPDETTKTENGPKKTYKKGLIEIVFINDKADWFSITPTTKVPFAKESLAQIGLEALPPTFHNPQIIMKWEPYKNYPFVAIFLGQNEIDYFYVRTKTK